MEIDITFLTMVAGFVGTFVTAITTKYDSGDLTKGLVSLTWAAVASIAGPIFSDGSLPADWSAFSQDFLGVWLSGLLAWLGITSEWNEFVNRLTATTGLGRLTALAPPES